MQLTSGRFGALVRRLARSWAGLTTGAFVTEGLLNRDPTRTAGDLRSEQWNGRETNPQRCEQVQLTDFLVLAFARNVALRATT